MLDDMLDDAVLAGRVAPLDQHEDPLAALDQMTLKLDQLYLQLVQLLPITVRCFVILSGAAFWDIQGRLGRTLWRRGRDSNPRSPARRTTVFETAPFDRSGTSPTERAQGLNI
jgi:hypothetical protein